MAKHKVGALSAFPPGSLKRVLIEGMPICIVHAPDGGLYAIDDRCTHEGDSLSEGAIWGMEVECPLHLSRFDVRTGAVTGPPAMVPTQTYTVTVQEEHVYVDIPALSAS